ncbi:1,4-alpha-glucan branching protein [Nonomuraea sp. NPDC050663]|uniref:maltokinase N-terminal cap-like domain-containing protein n=1 Tax=Nonomuraea sp. NPDC050663 TaxID=3364370 RepID=UPI0037B0F5E9
MAVVHNTTLKPTKLELLTTWLPTRPWYAGGSAVPRLTKAGGFRLDDPAGEVGIEFMVVTDTSGPAPVSYLTPLTYRGAALEGADHALIGTMEHGVLGRRWAYDGCHDPVLVEQLLALIAGRAQAQQQSVSDAPDLEVTRSYTGEALSSTATATDDGAGTKLTTPEKTTVHLQRVLRPQSSPPSKALGHVTGAWDLPDSTRTQGTFLVVPGPANP